MGHNIGGPGTACGHWPYSRPFCLSSWVEKRNLDALLAYPHKAGSSRWTGQPCSVSGSLLSTAGCHLDRGSL